MAIRAAVDTFSAGYKGGQWQRGRKRVIPVSGRSAGITNVRPEKCCKVPHCPVRSVLLLGPTMRRCRGQDRSPARSGRPECSRNESLSLRFGEAARRGSRVTRSSIAAAGRVRGAASQAPPSQCLSMPHGGASEARVQPQCAAMRFPPRPQGPERSPGHSPGRNPRATLPLFPIHVRFFYCGSSGRFGGSSFLQSWTRWTRKGCASKGPQGHCDTLVRTWPSTHKCDFVGLRHRRPGRKGHPMTGVSTSSPCLPS